MTTAHLGPRGRAVKQVRMMDFDGRRGVFPRQPHDIAAMNFIEGEIAVAIDRLQTKFEKDTEHLREEVARLREEVQELRSSGRAKRAA